MFYHKNKHYLNVFGFLVVMFFNHISFLFKNIINNFLCVFLIFNINIFKNIKKYFLKLKHESRNRSKTSSKLVVRFFFFPENC
jgi:hypothetical protein